MSELIIDAELQSLLDASRANVERRAALYPNLRRYTADISPPTASAAITNPPACTYADGVGDLLRNTNQTTRI